MSANEKIYRIGGVAYDYYSKLNETIMQQYIDSHVLAELTAWKSNFVAPANAKNALYTVRDWSVREVKRCPYCGSRDLEREPSAQSHGDAFEQFNKQRTDDISHQADSSNAFLFSRCRDCGHIFYTSPVDLQNRDLRILAVKKEFAEELKRYGEPTLKDAFWAWDVPVIPWAVAEICRHHGLLAGEKPRIMRSGRIVDDEIYMVGDDEYAFNSEDNIRRKQTYIKSQCQLDVTQYKEKLAAEAGVPNPIYRLTDWINWPDPASREMVAAIDGTELSEAYVQEMQEVYGKSILRYMKMYVVDPVFAELLREHDEPVLIDVNGGLCLWADLEYPEAAMRASMSRTCFAADVLAGQ
ncbi:MAG: hypothetical protein HDQ87_00480 [Clostridia bacterium]|nr:hypothetical protein [Clostridia bacterium]